MDTLLISRDLDELHSSLDQLALVGQELTDDQLDQATGGCLILLAFAVGFGVGFFGSMLVDGATS